MEDEKSVISTATNIRKINTRLIEKLLSAQDAMAFGNYMFSVELFKNIRKDLVEANAELTKIIGD